MGFLKSEMIINHKDHKAHQDIWMTGFIVVFSIFLCDLCVLGLRGLRQ